MRIDFDNLPSTIPDYSGFEQYIQFYTCFLQQTPLIAKATCSSPHWLSLCFCCDDWFWFGLLRVTAEAATARYSFLLTLFLW